MLLSHNLYVGGIYNVTLPLFHRLSYGIKDSVASVKLAEGCRVGRCEFFLHKFAVQFA